MTVLILVTLAMFPVVESQLTKKPAVTRAVAACYTSWIPSCSLCNLIAD